ncbi:MAG TPA: hypothetical protein VFR56_02935 [Actinomycetes bacterium]|nr:hypothetical protein [Actinomycetes bacterium]
MHTPDRRATAPTGIRRVRATLSGSDPSRRADPLADPLSGSDPTALPHRRPRTLPPPVA